VRFGRQNLNLHEPFLHTLVPVVVQNMGETFPELKKNPQQIVETIKDEEVGFIKTLDRGIELFNEAAADTRVIAAEAAFKLYDTYGFPIDLTRIMAEERGMSVDLAGYEKLMEEAKERSRAADKGAGNPVYDLPPDVLDELHKLNVSPTDDSEKYNRAPARATVRGIWTGKHLEQYIDVSDTRPGEPIAIILDKTNFYAEMGGQVGDAGEIRSNSHVVFNVETTRIVGGYVLHIGHLKSGRLAVADSATAYVMGGRERTEKNHTATHITNWALRRALGGHVIQKGSLVDSEKLRFDFQHPKAMSDAEISQVEQLVNANIAQKLAVHAEVAPQDQALKIHSLHAVFGEKYPPMVRVVTVGIPLKDLLANPGNKEWENYSIEFCGGTHLGNSAELEHFTIIAEESVSKGIRRLVALTGGSAKESLTQGQVIESLLTASRTAPEATFPNHMNAIQKAISGGNVPLLAKRLAQAAVAELQDRHKKWQRSNAEAKQDSSSSFDPESLLAGAESIHGIALIVGRVPGASVDTLRQTWDWLKKKHPQQNLAVLLASEFVDTDKDGNKLPAKANLLAAVGDPHIDKIKAGDWIKAVAPVVGGSGGGRPQLAMAGGKEPGRIDEAIEAGRTFAAKKLA